MARNYALPGGVMRYGRSAMYRKKFLWKKKPTSVAAPKVAEPTTKEVKVGGSKNGGTRVVPRVKPSKYVLAETGANYTKKRTRPQKAPKLRASITPGTILILVAGPYRGARVVFLKQLASGLLLVTGPFAVNGVPIRRVNQAYVIATSTQVDVSGVDASKFDDKYFKKADAKAKAKSFVDGVAQPPAKVPLTDERKADQAALDKAVIAAVGKVPHLKAYLKARFSLRKGEYPHQLKF